MASIIEQLTAAAVTDKLDAARTEEEWPKFTWAASRGTFGSGSTGWKPPGFSTPDPASNGGTYYKKGGILTGGGAFAILEFATSFSAINTPGEPRETEVWVFGQATEKANGYKLVAVQATSGTTTPRKYKFRLKKYVEGTATLLEETGEVTIEIGGAWALAVLNGKLTMYRRETEGSAWVQVGTEISDSTFKEGYTGIGGNGSNPTLNDFRTGLLEAVETEEKFYRRFAVESDVITLGEGGLKQPMSHDDHGITLVMLCRPSGSNAGRPLVCGSWVIFSSGLNPTINGAESSSASTAMEKNQWNLYVVTVSKRHAGGNGSNQARVHNYRFSTKAWAHAETQNQSLNFSATGGITTIGGKTGVVVWEGDIAAVMCIPAYLTDAEVETLVNAATLGEWNKWSPAALWFLNQKETGISVKDLTGLGADQTALTGTTVISEAPPMAYGVAANIAKAPAILKIMVGGAIKLVRRWVIGFTEHRAK